MAAVMNYIPYASILGFVIVNLLQLQAVKTTLTRGVCVCVYVSSREGCATSSVVRHTRTSDSTEHCHNVQSSSSAVETEFRHSGHYPRHARPLYQRTKVTKRHQRYVLTSAEIRINYREK